VIDSCQAFFQLFFKIFLPSLSFQIGFSFKGLYLFVATQTNYKPRRNARPRGNHYNTGHHADILCYNPLAIRQKQYWSRKHNTLAQFHALLWPLA